MSPTMLRFLTDTASLPIAIKRYRKRREWLMKQCSGPIVLMSPAHGPNQRYPWAHCDAPVYQDSYLLFLTGINQFPFQIILDPISNHQYIFLPDHDPKKVFWEGHSFANNDETSEAFLKDAGFTHIYSSKRFRSMIDDLIPRKPNWHLLFHEKGRTRIQDEAIKLVRTIRRKSTHSPSIVNISDVSWKQRVCHDSYALESIKEGLSKTRRAYLNTLSNLSSFKTEYELSGYLKGELLKQSPFGLSFPPIIARNDNAAILHYTDSTDKFKKNDLILLDFGLRWQSMCTDISRTIPLSGTYTNLQRCLIDIVLEAQEYTIQFIKPGVTFDELNTICWPFIERLLDQRLIKQGGRLNRPYIKKPHNVGHLLGIQTHDGDPFRGYATQPLEPGNIITIEPGLYGNFELNNESIHCGIRIEDNILVTESGFDNLSKDIPKLLN